MQHRSRIRGFVIILGLVLGVLIVRLFSISITQHQAYIAQASNQQNVERDILPQRGEIFVQDAAAGKATLVAESIQRYALSATPRNVQNKDEYATLIANKLNLDKATVLASLSKPGAYTDPFVHSLTKDQVDILVSSMNDLNQKINPGRKASTLNFDAAQGDILYFINGFFFIREYERVYPEDGLLGQELGFVDDKGKGQYGFEGQYDDGLRGYAGQVSIEKDSLGTLLGTNGGINGQDGNSYALTLDRNVQQYIEQALAQEVSDSEAQGGSVIVMDPRTGEIRGMASYPSYDPNDFRNVAKQNISLFDNPAISKQWEPGSIFKPLIMAAAIDQGVVTPDTRSTFASNVTVDGYQINTALDKAYGDESMTDVLVNSDNVAMVWLANKMGNQMISDYLARYGFGHATGVDLKNEIGGTVLPLNQWGAINRATMSFGQGIAVTPLQVITAYTAIANNGQEVKPHLVQTVIHPNGTTEAVQVTEGQQVMKPETAAQLRQMLTAVVVHNHKKAEVAGYEIGGKTGTAQVPNPNGKGYLDGAYNHSFVGMGPMNAPQFIVLTKIDQPNIAKVGDYAEATAVPLFSKVANFLLHYYQITPTK